MSRTEERKPEDLEDDMLPEYDLSKAIRSYTAYRIGEDANDEHAVEEFWSSLGFQVERFTELGRLPLSGRELLLPDLLLKRRGVPVAVCEIKSMDDFDYTVSLLHEDKEATETRHNWHESSQDRVLQRADLAKDQLAGSNEKGTLANLFVFVNHDPHTQRKDVQASLLGVSGVDATLWFEAKSNALDPNPVVIASPEGQQRLKDQLGLVLETRLSLSSAA